MNDNDIINYCFIDKNGKLCNHIVKNKLINMNTDMINYLNSRFKDSESLNESVYRIKLNIENRPVCQICGNKVKYLRKGKFGKCCCNSCVGKLSIKNTYEKYGVKSSLLLDENKEKTKLTLIKKYGVDNISKNELIKLQKKQTFIKNFGYENNFCNKDILNKAIKNSITKEARNKRHVTNNIKYGCDEYLSTTKGKTLSEEHKKKISIAVSSEEFQNKRNNTLNKNHSWNISKYEESTYNELLKYTNSNDIIRQYKSKLYPFNCDFYIKSINTYIEVQCSHFHHFHPFDMHNENDINELNKLKQNNKPQYKAIINVWTEKDPYKRMIAKENNLNYIEIWPNDNIKEIIKNLFQI